MFNSIFQQFVNLLWILLKIIKFDGSRWLFKKEISWISRIDFTPILIMLNKFFEFASISSNSLDNWYTIISILASDKFTILEMFRLIRWFYLLLTVINWYWHNFISMSNWWRIIMIYNILLYCFFALVLFNGFLA